MKKIVYVIALCAVAALMFTGCAGNANPAVYEEDLLHHNFVLVSVDGKTYKGKAEPNIAFNEGMRVSGAVCNSFFGQAELENNTLTVRQMASTKKLCFEQELNQYEYLISMMLMGGVELRYNNNLLTMKTTEHTLVYKLRDLVK